MISAKICSSGKEERVRCVGKGFERYKRIRTVQRSDSSIDNSLAALDSKRRWYAAEEGVMEVYAFELVEKDDAKQGIMNWGLLHRNMTSKYSFEFSDGGEGGKGRRLVETRDCRRFKANNLAVMTDAVHLLSDVSGLSVSLLAIKVSSWEANPRNSFGFKRLDVLAAFLSVQLIWLVSGVVIHEAIQRILSRSRENRKKL
ncbi:hypothetical protein Bca4012_036532 [Brassica carinata]